MSAIKIEGAVNGKISRVQLTSELDKKLINQLKTESEMIQNNRPQLTFIEKVALGLAHEEALGNRKGVRSDLLLRENFPEVSTHSVNLLDEKILRPGKTEEIAAQLAGFGNYKTYQQAKKIVQWGIPELITAVEKGLAISRAVKIISHSPEKQRYFLNLDRPVMIKALHEASSQKESNPPHENHYSNKIAKKNDGSRYQQQQ